MTKQEVDASGFNTDQMSNQISTMIGMEEAGTLVQKSVGEIWNSAYLRLKRHALSHTGARDF